MDEHRPDTPNDDGVSKDGRVPEATRGEQPETPPGAASPAANGSTQTLAQLRDEFLCVKQEIVADRQQLAKERQELEELRRRIEWEKAALDGERTRTAKLEATIKQLKASASVSKSHRPASPWGTRSAVLALVGTAVVAFLLGVWVSREPSTAPVLEPTLDEPPPPTSADLLRGGDTSLPSIAPTEPPTKEKAAQPLSKPETIAAPPVKPSPPAVNSPSPPPEPAAPAPPRAASGNAAPAPNKPAEPQQGIDELFDF